MPPPMPSAELPRIVLETTFRRARGNELDPEETMRIPPPDPVFELPVTVHLVTVAREPAPSPLTPPSPMLPVIAQSEMSVVS